jgi:hypothetical protein
MLSSRSTDFQQAAAYERQGSVDYPTNVPRDRFAYPAAMEDASFVVIDPLWRSWGAVYLPHTAAALQTVEAWPQAFVSGEIAVYRNPHPPPP